MTRTMTRYARLAPDPVRDHADFEVFIRELDASCVPPARTEDRRGAGAVGFATGQNHATNRRGKFAQVALWNPKPFGLPRGKITVGF